MILSEDSNSRLYRFRWYSSLCILSSCSKMSDSRTAPLSMNSSNQFSFSMVLVLIQVTIDFSREEMMSLNLLMRSWRLDFSFEFCNSFSASSILVQIQLTRSENPIPCWILSIFEMFPAMGLRGLGFLSLLVCLNAEFDFSLLANSLYDLLLSNDLMSFLLLDESVCFRSNLLLGEVYLSVLRFYVLRCFRNFSILSPREGSLGAFLADFFLR